MKNLLYKKLKLKPVGRGYFTIGIKTLFGGFKPFIINDIHIGHGGDIITPMKAKKDDCLKVLRFLRFCKNIKLNVSWQLMDRIKTQLNIDFFYLDEYKKEEIKII